MDVAKACLRAGRRDIVGVRSEYQQSGRGRRGRNWSAPAGTCLLVTYIFPAATVELRRFALAAPLAVGDAIQAIAGITPSIKWPNDLLVNHKKLAGILIETFSAQDQPPRNAVLVG